MHITDKRTDIIVSILNDQALIVAIADEYGEPGYGDPSESILIGDWNRVSDRLIEYLGDAGFDLHYYDEWDVHYEGDGKAYRTQADCHDWRPSLVFDGECGYIAESDGLEAAIDLARVDDESDALDLRFAPHWLTGAELAEAGWLPHAPNEDGEPEEFRNGWYGREDDPQQMTADLLKSGRADSVIVVVEGTGQFETRFSLWYMPREA